MRAIQNQEGMIQIENGNEVIITTLSPSELGIKEVVEGEIAAFEPMAIAQVEELKYLPFELSEMAVNILHKAKNGGSGYIYGTCGEKKTVWDSEGQVFVVLNNGHNPEPAKAEPTNIIPLQNLRELLGDNLLDAYTRQILGLKTTIGRSFLEIGRLLSEVRAQKIYQENYPTFDSYLADIFSQSRATAYALMQIYESNLAPELCLEIGWAKARELASLEPVELVPAETKAEIKEIAKDPGTSTKEVKEIVKKVKAEPEKPVKEVIKEVKEEIAKVKDNPESKNKTICEYCGKEKDGLAFWIGASPKDNPDWTMVEGTGKVACPDCYIGKRIAQLKTEIIDLVQEAKTVEDIDYIGGLLMDLRDFFENEKV